MNPDFYWQSKKMEMGGVSRFAVRLVTYATYSSLTAAALVLVFAELRWMQSLGLLISLFLIDRLLHLSQSERIFTYLPKSGRVNLDYYLKPAVSLVLEKASEKAAFIGGNIFLWLIKECLEQQEVRKILLRLDISWRAADKKLEELLNKQAGQHYSKNRSIKMLEPLIKEAAFLAIENNEKEITAKEIFTSLGLLTMPDTKDFFNQFRIEPDDLKNILVYTHLFSNLSFLNIIVRWPKRLRYMNRAWTARPTPILNKFSVDLTNLAREEKNNLLVGHQAEYRQFLEALSRGLGVNVLLLGKDGVGKSTIIYHLAFNLIKDKVSPFLFDKRLVQLNIGKLMSGANQSQIQERVVKITEEIERAGNIILYVPKISQLVNKEIILTFMNNNRIALIGSEEKEIEGFAIIRIKEISETETVQVLIYKSLILEKKYNLVISFSAIKAAARLAKRCFADKLFPGGALDLLEETIVAATEKGFKTVDANQVSAIAEKKVGIPLHELNNLEADQLLKLEDNIHQRLVNQEEAVRAVAQSLRIYRSGLKTSLAPIAAFLFVGPTGVGKTELAKTLAAIVFSSEINLVRFDMSEYQEKKSVSRLMERLSGAVRSRPYSVLLFDELEKAHADLLNLFLQIFDEGQLTDEVGRRINFRDIVIIATSNAHSQFIKEELEKGGAINDLHEKLIKKLSSVFKPELLNRFSKIVVFKSLSAANIKAIANLKLNNLANKLRKNNNLIVNFDQDLVEKISRLGFDQVFGARALERVIKDRIEAPLAEKILKKEISSGDMIKLKLE